MHHESRRPCPARCHYLGYAVFALLLPGCGQAASQNPEQADNIRGASVAAAARSDGLRAFPLSTAAASPGSPRRLFTLLDSGETGVELVNQFDIEHPRDYLFHSGFACGGVSIGDLNGDGRPDLFFLARHRGQCAVPAARRDAV